MENGKLSFGEVVADVAERRQLEQEMFAKKWAAVDVQWWEMRLQQERDKVGSGTDTSTFFQDRNEMQVEAFRVSHDRGNFRLPEEMSRAEYVAFNSTELDPVTGFETPLKNPPTELDVFDRPEVSAVMARIIAEQGDGSLQAVKRSPAREPVMWVVTEANRRGLIMGLVPGPVFDRLRPAEVAELLKQGRVAFRGETEQSREQRVNKLFELALNAVAMRTELQQAANELAGAEKLGGRVFESSRPAITNAIREIEREAAKLGPFARWILEGDEMKRLREQLARIDRALEQARKGLGVMGSAAG